ncbi:MAG: hypothetical protein KAK00_09475 [Nanoarchaeota archaeon]|nr:hypothetical protein [Nanoarchaeota archaeon]
MMKAEIKRRIKDIQMLQFFMDYFSISTIRNFFIEHFIREVICGLPHSFTNIVKWNFRQFIYFLVLLGTIAAMYHFTPVNIVIKLIVIVPISVIVLILIHIKLDEKFTSRQKRIREVQQKIS